MYPIRPDVLRVVAFNLDNLPIGRTNKTLNVIAELAHERVAIEINQSIVIYQ